MNKQTIRELAKLAYGAGGNASAVTKAFERMSIAEEVLRSVPKGGRGTGLFAALCPSPILLDKSLDLYRAHAKELVQRYHNSIEFSHGTKAEVLALLSDASTRAPLARDHAQLANKLFEELFPSTHATVFDGEKAREQWPNELADLLALYQRKLRVER